MTQHTLRIRTYPQSPWADVWLVRREGASESAIMHGRMMPDKLLGLLDLMDYLEGVVSIEREVSPWDGPTKGEMSDVLQAETMPTPTRLVPVLVQHSADPQQLRGLFDVQEAG